MAWTRRAGRTAALALALTFAWPLASQSLADGGDDAVAVSPEARGVAQAVTAAELADWG